jgi:hypothetical protein
MAPTVERKFTKDGQTRSAYTPAQVVNLHGRGWQEVSETPQVPAADILAVYPLPDVLEAPEQPLSDTEAGVGESGTELITPSTSATVIPLT